MAFGVLVVRHLMVLVRVVSLVFQEVGDEHAAIAIRLVILFVLLLSFRFLGNVRRAFR